MLVADDWRTSTSMEAPSRPLALCYFPLALNPSAMKSPHILNAASNLLGICFILLTSFKIFNISRNTLYDEFIVAAILLFMGSCIFSFLALRKQDKTSETFEKLADYMFLGGLGALFVITALFAASII